LKPIINAKIKSMKRKTEEKSEEFSRFEKLGKQLVNVPKKDVQDQEKKEAKKKSAKPI